LTTGWLLAGTAGATPATPTTPSPSDGINPPVIFNAAGYLDTNAKPPDTKPGCSPDGPQAGKTRLNTPTGVAIDSLGDMLFAETLCNKIRLVHSSTNGSISTVAGNGTFGFSGDGMPATSAELAVPTGVAVDGSGDTFIADTGNNRIREVTPNGIIKTFYGTGSCSVLCLPTAVSVDNGNVYVTDTLNSRVLSISIATGTATTIANSGQVQFPEGVAADPSSHKVYVGDTFDNQIKVITLPADTVTVLAGTGARGYADGPPLSAKFNRPTGVAIGQGNVYVSDTGNDRIRQIATTATPLQVTTYVNQPGVLGYTGDGGQAISAEINLPVFLTSDQSFMGSWGVSVHGQNCTSSEAGINSGATQTICAATLPTGVAGAPLSINGMPSSFVLFLSDTHNNHVRAVTVGGAPVIPESSYTLLLPISAVALIGGGYVFFRRRRRHSGPVQVSV
jgi:DNA-binding beta-propeller fold protein YncE